MIKCKQCGAEYEDYASYCNACDIPLIDEDGNNLENKRQGSIFANEIIGIENMSTDELNYQLRRGGRFVYFQYCVSIIIVTFKRPSNIYFIKAGESAFGKSIGFTFTSLIAGWWGIPWGPIYTISSLITNISGGKTITDEVVAFLSKNKNA